MRFLTGVAIGAFMFIPAVAGAQTAPAGPAGAQSQPTTPPAAGAAAAATPTVGATVYDSTGAVLGTVEQVTPQAVVVNVGGAKVGLPPAAVGAGPQGLRVATTRADIEAQAKQAQAGQQAQLASQLTPGVTVRGAGGATVGTVKSADSQYVTLTTPKGDVQLPIAGFSADANGPRITLTAAQLDAAIAQAGGGQATSGTTTTSDTTASASTDTAAQTATTSPDAAATSDATSTETRSTTTQRTRRAPR